MRDRINLEVEEFKYNLHTILNKQQSRIHQLIELSRQSTDQVGRKLQHYVRYIFKCE